MVVPPSFDPSAFDPPEWPVQRSSSLLLMAVHFAVNCPEAAGRHIADNPAFAADNPELAGPPAADRQAAAAGFA